MKFNYPLISRILIALVFVVAGVQKVTGFAGTVSFVDSLGVPFATLAVLLVILIEVPVAIAYAWGYRVCVTGGILVAFTVMTTILVHRDINSGVNMIMALKNIAIIGGILATTGTCSCGRCYGLNPKDK